MHEMKPPILSTINDFYHQKALSCIELKRPHTVSLAFLVLSLGYDATYSPFTRQLIYLILLFPRTLILPTVPLSTLSSVRCTLRLAQGANLIQLTWIMYLLTHKDIDSF